MACSAPLVLIYDDGILPWIYDPDLLSYQRVHQFVDYDGKSDGRRLLAELLGQMVVSSALYDGVSCAEGVTPEDESGVVPISTTHAEVKSKKLLYSVELQSFVDSLKSPDGSDAF